MLDLKWSSEQIFSTNCRWVPLSRGTNWLPSSMVENFKWGPQKKKKKKKEKKGRSKVRTRTFVTGDLACERKPEGTTGNDMTLRFTVF